MTNSVEVAEVEDGEDNIFDWAAERTKHGIFLMEGEEPRDIIERLSQGLHDATSIIDQLRREKRQDRNKTLATVAILVAAIVFLSCLIISGAHS